MAPDEAATLALRELATQIRLDLKAIEREADAVSQGAAEIDQGADHTPWLAAIAVHLDRFYTAAEAAFQRIASTLGEPLPSGHAWHNALLHQMTIAPQDTRPAVIRTSTEANLKEPLKFRHWLRHAYRAPLNWTRMQGVVRDLPAIRDALRTDLEAFLEWLDETTTPLDQGTRSP